MSHRTARLDDRFNRGSVAVWTAEDQLHRQASVFKLVYLALELSGTLEVDFERSCCAIFVRPWLGLRASYINFPLVAILKAWSIK